jgi:hypothetical protein
MPMALKLSAMEKSKIPEENTWNMVKCLKGKGRPAETIRHYIAISKGLVLKKETGN